MPSLWSARAVDGTVCSAEHGTTDVPARGEPRKAAKNAGRRHRVLTIAVELATRTIRDARRPADAWPKDKHRGILERWAGQEGLTIGW
jgi:hypothetical protein